MTITKPFKHVAHKIYHLLRLLCTESISVRKYLLKEMHHSLEKTRHIYTYIHTYMRTRYISHNWK